MGLKKIEKTKAFRLKKMYLGSLKMWLEKQELIGKDSRKRTHFSKLLMAGILQLDKDREEIISRYVVKKKNKDGNEEWEKFIDEGGNEKWKIKDGQDENITAELQELFNEDYVLDVTEANKEMLASVKNTVLETNYKFGPKEGDSLQNAENRLREANEYDFWCEAFEGLDL